MSEPNYYEILDIHTSASPTEVKQAYRRLAKLFHPDSNPDIDNHEQITQINAAYETLSDPHRRQSYDQALQAKLESAWHARSKAASKVYQKRQSGQDADAELHVWLQRVYGPVNRLLRRIIEALNDQIDDLSADPFDDELMEEFQSYLEDCRQLLKQAHLSFRCMPNPTNVAGTAANLYYCLNQVGDGLDELERYTYNYDEHYLHAGQEMFRIANRLRREAQHAVRHLV